MLLLRSKSAFIAKLHPILTTLASARLLLPAGLAAITDKLPKWQVGNIDRPPPRSRHSPRGGYAPLSLTSTSWGLRQNIGIITDPQFPRASVRVFSELRN